MCNNPIQYASANKIQRRESELAISNWFNKLQWTDNEVILDIGCGPGDVTNDILLPNIPKFKKMVGVDINKASITFANKLYADIPNLEFAVLDIAGLPTYGAEYYGKFSKVFSFFCFHWIRHLKLALTNVHRLMRNDGECLLVFLASCPLFDAYKILSQSSDASPFLKDVDNYIPVFQNKASPGKEFAYMMEQAGFCDIECEVLNREHRFYTYEDAKMAIKAVDPFVDKLPLDMQDDYLDKTLAELDRVTARIGEGGFVAKYDLIVAKARKA